MSLAVPDSKSRPSPQGARWLRPHGILRGGRGVVPRFRVARKSPAEGCNRERRGGVGGCTGVLFLFGVTGWGRGRARPNTNRSALRKRENVPLRTSDEE